MTRRGSNGEPPERYFHISVEDYLAGEKISLVRHEYVDGVVYAMAGGTVRHNQLTKNIGYRLEEHLAGGACRAFIVDMKVRVSSRVYYYPDVVVTCEQLADDALEIIAPRLVVEVLSPAMKRIDKHEKLLAYKNLESVQEYLIVWEDKMQSELHQRGAHGWRVVHLTQAEEEVELASIGRRLSLAEIYRQVQFPPIAENNLFNPFPNA